MVDHGFVREVWPGSAGQGHSQTLDLREGEEGAEWGSGPLASFNPGLIAGSHIASPPPQLPPGTPTSAAGLRPPHLSRRTHSARLDARWGPPSSSIGAGRPLSAPRGAAHQPPTLYAQAQAVAHAGGEGHPYARPPSPSLMSSGRLLSAGTRSGPLPRPAARPSSGKPLAASGRPGVWAPPPLQVSSPPARPSRPATATARTLTHAAETLGMDAPPSPCSINGGGGSFSSTLVCAQISCRKLLYHLLRHLVPLQQAGGTCPHLLLRL